MHVIIEHPVIDDKMTKLRSVETGTKEFREIVTEVASLLCYEALRRAPLEEVTIQTPLCEMTGQRLSNKYAVIPILRAGLGMEAGILHVLPNAKVGHIGIYRDPDSLEPQDYYKKFPTDIADRDVLLIDPMLATGGTASAAIDFLKGAGAKSIKFLCLVSCEEGVKKVHEHHKDVYIFSAHHDPILDEHAYIVPGLGDAGDRTFGTK